MRSVGFGSFLVQSLLVASCATRHTDQLSNPRDTGSGFDQEYSITSTVEILKPITLEAINNDFQEAKVVAETAKTVTLEVRTYPLRSQKPTITANPNWRQEYGAKPELQQWLKPGITTYWDEGMRQEIVAALANDGVNVDQLNDRQLVETVSRWLFGPPPFGKFPYKDFFVSYHLSFSTGAATVIPQLRASFDVAKNGGQVTTDDEAFAIGAYGKGMFKSRTHGNCTASATLAATVLRALGIPTRIVLFIPPVDSTDPTQVSMLQSAVHHSALLPKIMEGIGTQTLGWSSHTFNEVYVGNQWVRLNYTTLGQDPVDADYLGMMIQVLRVADWSESGLPETWGVHAMAHNVVQLSSNNPYRGLSVSDHVGSTAQLPNPPIPFQEIRKAKIAALLTRNSPGLPDPIRERLGPSFLLKVAPDTPNKENWKYFRLFAVHNHRFILRAPGHADVKAVASGSLTDKDYEGWRLYVNDPHEQMAPGIAYRAIPTDNSGDYRWEIPDSLIVTTP